MEITPDLVKHIAQLARLELQENEVVEYQEHLSKVLNYMEELESVDTNGIEPLFSPVFDRLQGQIISREDRIVQQWKPEDVIANAPSHRQNQFVVEAVIEED